MRKSALWLLLAIIVSLAGHLWLGARLGLSVDEAHYALYALHPALSYFDHPPLVGWLQIPFVAMGGADWQLRIMPLLLLTLSAGALYALVKFEWNSPRAASIAALLLLLAPLFHLLGLALVPDSLLLPLTVGVMFLTWRLSLDVQRLRLWLWLGLALGLSGLAKYTGALLALSVVLVLIRVHGARMLATRGPWLASLLALLLVSPILIWNMQHDWVSLRYQFGHVSHSTGAPAPWQFVTALRFVLVQFLAYGFLPLIGLLKTLRLAKQQKPDWIWQCWVFALPPILLSVYFSGKGTALPHWSAPGWIALLPIAAYGLHYRWSYASRLSPSLLGFIAAIQAFLVVGIGAVMLTAGLNVMPPSGNPFADLFDWSSAAAKARSLQVQNHADAIAVSNWTLASRMAWYARPSTVWALDGKNKQFELWFGVPIPQTQSSIWVDSSQMPFDPPKGCFFIDRYAGQFTTFQYYLCPAGAH